MKKPFLLVPCIVAVFVLLLLSGCNQKITTTTNSDAGLTQSVDQGILPVKVQGSREIYINGSESYLSDDGLQQIFLPKATGSDESDAIIEYLDNPKLNSNPRKISIKQATINVQGSNIVLIGGSGLQGYIKSSQSTTSISGNDLIITAHAQRTGVSSYLLISNTNPDNYMIQNNQNRYQPGLFMISKQSYTLVKIEWNNNLEYGRRLSHPKKDYDYVLNDYLPLSAIPQETALKLALPFIRNEPKIGVYHLSFATGTQSAYKNIYDTALISHPQGLKDQVRSLLANQIIDNFTALLANGSGEYTFTSSKAPKQALLLVTSAHAKLIEWENSSFTATIKKVDSANFPTEQFPYQIEIDTAYDLDFAALEESLQQILGTGSYQVGGTRHGFIYKLQPGKQYSGSLNIKNIFGQSLQLPLNLKIDSIDPLVITKQILSNNSISILPNSGSFQDLLVQYENISGFQVIFSPCTFTTTLDLKVNNGQGLENYLFDCSDTEYISEVKTPEFKYRKPYRTPVALPKDFPDTAFFKASIRQSAGKKTYAQMELAQEHYFMKSDIGIWTKVAGNSLNIWGFVFDNNDPIVSGRLTLSTLTGKVISDQIISGSRTVLDLPKNKDGEMQSDVLLVTITHDGYTGMVLVQPRGGSYMYIPNNQKSYLINSFLSPEDVLSSNQNIAFWGDEYPLKVYAYSDRGLYKAGDVVYFAGFVRDLRVFDNLNYLQNKTVSVIATDPQGNALYSNSGVLLDSFGGFKGSFALPKTLSLGDVIIRYQLAQDERASYSHNIQVKEYQKPSFFADTSYAVVDNALHLVVSPQYYFGQALKNYNIKIDWSLAGKDVCAYCRWWNEESYYYNYIFNDSISTGGSMMLYNQTSGSLIQALFANSLLKQKGYQYTLKANLAIKDLNSDETQFFTKYIDFSPEVKLGLSGQPSEWLYNDGAKDDRKSYTIDGTIAAGTKLVSRLAYELYYRSYDQASQKGIDGSLYYVNGNNYRLIGSGDIEKATNFKLSTSVIDKPGSYFYRVFAYGKDNTILGEVHKQVEYYSFAQDDDGLLGALPNNYTLTVSTPKKIYEEGDTIPIDIQPYQKGARVVMTVERGGMIIESKEVTLDGSPLSLLVKKGYAPNVVINVMELMGTDKSSGPRKEPRFLLGYTQADISTAMHELSIDIKTDKKVYKPGDIVKLSIATSDSKGNPIDARISLGVLDEALLGLYDSLKEPIPYFFNKLGSSVFNFTNMKLLYQSLKAFANNGSKGGGGNGGKASFSIVRDDLEDVAYWRGGVYTTGGKAELEFTLPENLTTRVIDAIGISKGIKLGTVRTSFVVAKDLIVEPNLPSFVTIGDALKVPVRIIVPADKIKNNQIIKLSAFIENSSGDKLDLGAFTAEPNTKILIPMEIPETWLSSSFVKLSVEGSYGDMSDGISQNIPLRTEGLIMKDSVGVIAQEGDHSFQIPEFRTATLSLSLSQFPTNLIDPVVSYLVAYPYGCTEQILSTLLPLHLSQDLQRSGKFKSELLSGDSLLLSEGKASVGTLLSQGIASILSRQQSDGSFGWWDALDSENTIQKYLLTTYVYGSLQILKKSASSQGEIEQSLRAAESYLWANRELSSLGFTYFMSQKAKAGIVLTSVERKILDSLKLQSLPYGGLLRYSIAVYGNNSGDIALWKPYATIPTNQDTWTENSLFLNQTTAYALKLQALSKDASATQLELMEALQNVVASRDPSGLRGRSTQNNVQSLIAILQVTQNWVAKDKVQCTVSIDGKDTNLQVSSGQSQLMTYTLNNKLSTIKRKCDNLIMADASVSFIPKSLEDLLGADSHVTQMNYSISNPLAKIGEIVDINASRSTTQAGEQVAVELFIPSTLKLLDSISSQDSNPENGGYAEGGGNPQFPFTVSDTACYPNHWEVRFDRLFLYYENLPALTCDISIQALQSYNGKATIMPMRIYEMYKGSINGRKVIKE